MLVSRLLEDKGADVVTTAPSEAAIDVVRLLWRERIGAAVVIDDDGRILGTFSERDIVYRIANEGAKALDIPVGRLIHRPFLSCRPTDHVKDVILVMTRRRVRHLPVIEGGQLCGIVSIGDVLKSRLDENELEINVLRDVARIAVH